MRFGVFFAHQLPRPWAETSESTLFQEALEQVELADRLGIEYCWGQEHHFLEEYSHSSAPEVFLAAFSQRTKNIRIGHGIVLMPPKYNHPARVAERISTLDLVSNGRVEWGTGESGTRIELEAFDIPQVEKRNMWAEAVRECAIMMSTAPYPGYAGKYFSLPPRNVVPKPVQKPHPPIWLACSNRESLRYAARNGVGALTFAFMNAAEAKFWVEEYYDTFRRECRPIGRAVNPNVAMLVQFMCKSTSEKARDLGSTGSKFFAFGLSHYYKTGTHIPGKTSVWDLFEGSRDFTHAGNTGIGSSMELRRNFEEFEQAGVDQLILLQQAGNYEHSEICESLQLFARDVLPEFKSRDIVATKKKQERLEQYSAKAMESVSEVRSVSPQPVECYPVYAKNRGIDFARFAQDRSPMPAAMWRLQIGGISRKR